MNTSSNSTPSKGKENQIQILIENIGKNLLNDFQVFLSLNGNNKFRVVLLSDNKLL